MSSIPSKQKALEIASFGDPLKGCLRLNTDAPVPQPGKDQVLVKMRYSCLNPADVFTVMGVYPGVPAVVENKPGFVGGMEGMGVVVAQGEGASLKVGTRVVPLLPNAGAWQQYVVVDAARCVPVPDGVEDKAAAQLVVNPLTVIGMLDEVERHTAVKDNPWIVQTAANSTLGRMLIQAAKGRGLRTINVVRSAATRDELKKLGADEVIVRAEEKDVPKRVHHITGGKGAIAALDAVGRPADAGQQQRPVRQRDHRARLLGRQMDRPPASERLPGCIQDDGTEAYVPAGGEGVHPRPIPGGIPSAVQARPTREDPLSCRCLISGKGEEEMWLP
eukprot:ctg_225.g86